MKHGAAADCGTGVRLWGICWYLGAAGDSCIDVCSTHGEYVDSVPEYVGTASQAGSLEECAAIFAALGTGGVVSEGYRVDGNGLGCHRWEDGALWWLSTPDFDPADAMDQAEVVCGCTGDAG